MKKYNSDMKSFSVWFASQSGSMRTEERFSFDDLESAIAFAQEQAAGGWSNYFIMVRDWNDERKPPLAGWHWGERIPHNRIIFELENWRSSLLPRRRPSPTTPAERNDITTEEPQ